jgi:hypothetical protein
MSEGGVSGLSSTATGRTSTMHCDLAARGARGMLADASGGQTGAFSTTSVDLTGEC